MNGDGESLRQVLNKLAFDKALFGNAFLEIVTDVRNTRSSRSTTRTPRAAAWPAIRRTSCCTTTGRPSAPKRPARCRSTRLVRDNRPTGRCAPRSTTRTTNRCSTHYGVPPYIAGFSVSAIAYKTDNWNISRLDNSFQLSGVMMLDSTVDNESEAERIVRLAEQKFAGNPGQVMFVIRDGGEGDNSRFIPIASQNEGDWQALHEQAVSDIVVAHSWFRTLSGLDYASGFSAERILHEYEVALNTVILGEQAELTEPVREAITSILGIDASSLQVINRPPTRSKPIYMKVWEARKADGLDYDPDDERQQAFLSEITKYNIRSIE